MAVSRLKIQPVRHPPRNHPPSVSRSRSRVSVRRSASVPANSEVSLPRSHFRSTTQSRESTRSGFSSPSAQKRQALSSTVSLQIHVSITSESQDGGDRTQIFISGNARTHVSMATRQAAVDSTIRSEPMSATQILSTSMACAYEQVRDATNLADQGSGRFEFQTLCGRCSRRVGPVFPRGEHENQRFRIHSNAGDCAK
jgi:hypothetical protein